MIIWLHENLYRYVKDNPTFNDIVTRTQSIWGDGDISTYHSIFTPERRKIYTKARIDYYDFFANLDMPEDLKIRWQISTITDWFNRDNHLKDDEDYPIGVWMQEQMQNPQASTNALSIFTSFADYTPEEFFKKMEEKIESLPDSSDKISCKIYLMQHKISDFLENLGYSYFDPKIYELRKEILHLYKLDNSYNYEEETHICAYSNNSDVFFIDNVNSDVKKDKDWVMFAYERLFNTLNFYKETSLRIHPTDYMKNNLAQTNLTILNNFYTYFVAPFSNRNESFAELDDWFEEKYNGIDFKYKDFNYYKLKHLWDRFSANMGHSEYARGIDILQNTYDLIFENMQNKNLMGKKMNSLATNYHTGFFAFISSIRKLETEILNNLDVYTNKNQFNNLIFSANEEKLIADDWCGDENLTQWRLNYSWLSEKLNG
jgi:hypothetical protein